MAEWRRGEQEMLQLGNAYSTSNWFVMAGSEEEFVRRWTALAEWVKNNVPGARSAVLIRSTDDPRRFLSVSCVGDAGSAGCVAREVRDAGVA
jgi:Antibiotic biosynthesis monooxygenase